MKIRKTEIPNLDTESKIEAAVQIHRSEEKARFEDGVNEAYTQHVKIRDLSIHLQNNGEWKFIDKTLEEEKEDTKIEADKLAEKAKKDRIILAKTDGKVRDLLITELMNESNFNKTDVLFKKFQYENDEIGQTEFDQFMSNRLGKFAEIKTMISESQNETI